MIEKYVRRNCFSQIESVKSIMVVGEKSYESSIYLSYVIPTNNRIETLKKAVNSVLNIEHQVSYEIIVVDNSECFEKDAPGRKFFLQLNNPHIRYYINEKNIGMEGNWNRGVELAMGKYISFLHDDDLLDINYEKGVVQCLRRLENASKEIGFIKVGWVPFSSDENLPQLRYKLCGEADRIDEKYCLFLGGGGTAPPTCGMIFNRNALLKTGGFDSILHPSADQIMGFLILQQGYAGYKIPDQLAYYRIAVNESMHKSAQILFAKKDDLIRNYMYESDSISRIFGWLFKNIQYTISLNGICRDAHNTFQVNVSLEEIDFKRTYKRRVIGVRLFNLLKLSYVLMKVPQKIFERIVARIYHIINKLW